MTRDEVFNKLNEIFREVFDDDEIEVSEETTSDDIEDWDSLEHINLVAAMSRWSMRSPLNCWNAARIIPLNF